MDEAEKHSLAVKEIRRINDMIDLHKGNMVLVASSLGIGRATIYRRLKKYNIINYRAKYKAWGVYK